MLRLATSGTAVGAQRHVHPEGEAVGGDFRECADQLLAQPDEKFVIRQ